MHCMLAYHFYPLSNPVKPLKWNVQGKVSVPFYKPIPSIPFATGGKGTIKIWITEFPCRINFAIGTGHSPLNPGQIKT